MHRFSRCQASKCLPRILKHPRPYHKLDSRRSIGAVSHATTMFAPSRSRVLEKAISGTTVTLPGFLVPAFQVPPRCRFSATPSTSSKLGRTPISIPPGVEISIGEPVAKKDATTYLRIAKRTVTVVGPLGKLDLVIPPFLAIDHDAKAGKALLSIEDSNLKEQKEMWGT